MFLSHLTPGGSLCLEIEREGFSDGSELLVPKMSQRKGWLQACSYFPGASLCKPLIPSRDGDPLLIETHLFQIIKKNGILTRNPRFKLMVIARISWTLTMCQGTALSSFNVDYFILPHNNSLRLVLLLPTIDILKHGHKFLGVFPSTGWGLHLLPLNLSRL